LHYAKADTAVSTYTYYKEIAKPSFMSKVKKYTIGLPFTILGALKKKHTNTVSVSNIPTPLIRNISELDEGMKTDPVKFISSWKSANNRYLNLEMSLMTGNADGDTQMQKIGCICDSVTTTDTGESNVWLSLYHDQGGVPEYYSAKVYMSIKTSRLPVEMKKGDQVILRIPTYSGFIIRTFSY